MTSSASTVPRVAIVTGSAQGIGKYIALRLARDGLDVVINDLPNKSKEVEKVAEQVRQIPVRKALTILGDANSEEDVSALISRTLAELGSLYVVSVYSSNDWKLASEKCLSSWPMQEFIKENLF